jgi:hypothetical protein
VSTAALLGQLTRHERFGNLLSPYERTDSVWALCVVIGLFALHTGRHHDVGMPLMCGASPDDVCAALAEIEAGLKGNR